MYAEQIDITQLTPIQAKVLSRIAYQTWQITGRSVALRDPELLTKLEIILRQTHEHGLLRELLSLAEELRDLGTVCLVSERVVEDFHELGVCVSYAA
ncbi:hypothetical protein GCM10008090_01740 [Arenicella chitinivorans]|uniref:Uncharacterized protein n=1 Tax=Arenicella chitinivorans TaxID=1329800 RepID=A0A918RHH7_9GAMM|nr:hypothetical protein [Arenicella chitinivorans]GGZ97118.1 hypothetical protein GCM10008090_01740 [Arenicella chitinivorans]